MDSKNAEIRERQNFTSTIAPGSISAQLHRGKPSLPAVARAAYKSSQVDEKEAKQVVAEEATKRVTGSAPNATCKSGIKNGVAPLTDATSKGKRVTVPASRGGLAGVQGDVAGYSLGGNGGPSGAAAGLAMGWVNQTIALFTTGAVGLGMADARALLDAKPEHNAKSIKFGLKHNSKSVRFGKKLSELQVMNTNRTLNSALMRRFEEDDEITAEEVAQICRKHGFKEPKVQVEEGPVYYSLKWTLGR